MKETYMVYKFGNDDVFVFLLFSFFLNENAGFEDYKSWQMKM